MNNLITITTDFGDQFATSQLEAVAFSLGFEGRLIENHDVKPFSVVEGAYGIWQLAKFCPEGTVHVGIVDPGVGSERAGIVIKTKNFWFVGPDNGLLWPAADADEIVNSWKLEEKEFGEVANTFHGRDIFIKLAVRLAQGEEPKGEKVEIKRLEFQNGQVLHIDSYGNAKIWGNGHLKLPKVKTFSQLPLGASGLVWGSSDTWEIVVNQGSAADKFGLKLGQIIKDL